MGVVILILVAVIGVFIFSTINNNDEQIKMQKQNFKSKDLQLKKMKQNQ